MPSISKTVKTLLLAGAILAPAIALAFLGLRAYRAEALLFRERYRQDQAAIVRLVADRASETARKAIEDLEERVRTHEPDALMEERFRAAHPLAKHIFLVRDGRLVYPSTPSPDLERPPARGLGPGDRLLSKLDVENYVSRLRESRRLDRLLSLAVRAEQAGSLAEARRNYSLASRGRGDPGAQALLGLARINRRQGRAAEAEESYRALRRRFEGQQDHEGVSYALLGDAGRAELGDSELLLRIHRRLLEGEYLTSGESRRYYLRWTVERLAAAGKDPSVVARLLRSTAHHFASEQFGRTLLRHGVAELQQLAPGSQVGSLVLDRRTILVLRQNRNTLVGYSLDEGPLRARVAGRDRGASPPARGVELVLGRVGESHALPRERVLHASILPPPLADWTLTAVRAGTDPMDQLERREGLRRQGTVLGLIVVLLVGLLLTYRGVRRESELARLKSDFASNVSHELKTPLTSIRMYAEMLEHGIAATAADRGRYQQVIIRESERLGRLIANILDFSRIERGTRRYDLRAEDLGELAGEALETFARLSEGEHIQIRMHANGQAPHVRADREAAIQSILNLLSNAAKYSPDAPEIDVKLKVGVREVGIEVSDRGIGIPPAEQKRIFDDFYRAPGARRAGVEGTGLGLALVRRHMSACGGRVELHSTPGKGSTFTLWFAICGRGGDPPRSEESTDGHDPGD